MTNHTPIIERFWAKVGKSGPNECWHWSGARGRGGYGIFWDGEKMGTATRWIYSYTSGLHLSKEDLIRHSCDNPPCVNPTHLIKGTHQDNMDDRHTRGRSRSAAGEASNLARLDESQVLAIRALHADSGLSQAGIGRMYGVTDACVWRIVHRRTWNHV